MKVIKRNITCSCYPTSCFRNRKELHGVRYGYWHRRRAISVIIAFFALVQFNGCSIAILGKQPSSKEIHDVHPGLSRNTLLGYFGMPVETKEIDGDKIDIFRFRQGPSKAARAARSYIHYFLDWFTLGIWEIVATPLELILRGPHKELEVRYDGDLKIKEVAYRDSPG